jgi:hypothetical protein
MSETTKSGGEAPIDDRDGTATYRELREYSRGVLDVDHQDVHPVAGLIGDEQVREALGFMAEVYNPSEEHVEAGMPRNFWETEFARRAIRKFGTKAASEAIAEGNLTQAAYFTGSPSYESDVSGLHAINQLVDWLVHSEQCKLVYLAALMGRGKTDLSLTLLEVIHDHYRRLDRAGDLDVATPTPEFAANFHVEPSVDGLDVEEIRHYERLDEWAERGSSDEERWFIFDEASTELTAQSGANAQKVAETMGPFVKKMRKKGVNMVVIGHDKGDIHVAIRSLADFIDKTGLKSASFYAGINNREPQGHLFDLDGIPPTSWQFDTDDTAEWCWCEGDRAIEGCPHRDGDAVDEDVGMTDQEFKQEVSERAARVYLATPDEVTLEDVAAAVSTEAVSISAATVSRYKRELEAAEKTPDAAAKA